MAWSEAHRLERGLTVCAFIACLASGGCGQPSPAALLGVEAAQEALDDLQVRGRVEALRSGAGFVHELPDGTRALIFRDGRHVVVALDDDGDMPADATEPDRDSDCLAVDMDGDGRIDRTIDYDDLDGDGRADRMVLTFADRNTWGNRPFLVVIRDLDRGPLTLWKLRDYNYVQSQCQWECDFGGDGWFAMFRRARRGDRWQGALECPFCFYDVDGDGLAEETVRIVARDRVLRSARYGINADNDTTDGHLYDYDLSVTCLGSVALPPGAAETLNHRSGARIGPFLRWDQTRAVVRAARWQRCLLIWDENDHNVAAYDHGRERWEGIINRAYRGFPQEGGPPTPRFNRRFELDADYSGQMRLYFWPADGRLHLLGAEQGSLEADFDYDGQVDLLVEYADRDGDGRFDERAVTYPGTELPARRIPGGPADTATFDCSYAAIGEHWQAALRQWTARSGELKDVLVATAEELGLPGHWEPLDFYEGASSAQFAYIERLRASAEACRYYLDLTIELGLAHMIADARAAGLDEATCGRIASALNRYHTGDLRGAIRALKSSPPT